MDNDVAVGFGIGLLFVLILAFMSFASALQAEKDIASSCELSGHVVIRDKAYECKLIN